MLRLVVEAFGAGGEAGAGGTGNDGRGRRCSRETSEPRAVRKLSGSRRKRRGLATSHRRQTLASSVEVPALSAQPSPFLKSRRWLSGLRARRTLCLSAST